MTGFTKKKKAFFFSFISIMILGFFMIVFSNMYSSRIFAAELDVESARVINANSFVSFVEDNYIPRILLASTRWATLTLIDHINQTNQPVAPDLDSLDEVYKNLIMNGTRDGTSATYMVDMDGYTLEQWLTNLSEEVSESFHFELDFDLGSASLDVYQQNAWRMGVNFSIDFTLLTESASWNSSAQYLLNYSIVGFDDPIYLMNEEPDFYNQIFESNYTRGRSILWLERSLFEDSLYDHGYYLKNTKGMSFLQRMINSTQDEDASFCCGIQSLVNPGVNAPSTIPSNNFSYVDTLFFNKTVIGSGQLHLVDGCHPPGSYDNLTDSDGKFKIDRENLIFYNMTMLYCGGATDTDPGNCITAGDPGAGSCILT